jgi:hypothetical protein
MRARSREFPHDAVTMSVQMFNLRYCRAEECAKHRDCFVREDAKNAVAYAGVLRGVGDRQAGLLREGFYVTLAFRALL